MRGRAAVRHLRRARGRATPTRCSRGCADETGVDLQVLSGEEEARLTFLAARRWFGWSAGKLLVLDIGGGSLEIAYGIDEEPDAAVSLPLGAGRLTAGWLPGRPAGRRRTYGRCAATCAREIARTVGEFSRFGAPDHVVGHLQDLPAARPDRGRRPLAPRASTCSAS